MYKTMLNILLGFTYGGSDFEYLAASGYPNWQPDRIWLS